VEVGVGGIRAPLLPQGRTKSYGETFPNSRTKVLIKQAAACAQQDLTFDMNRGCCVPPVIRVSGDQMGWP